MEVYKFGGASVMSAEAIKNLAKIIKDAQKENLLIVVSAMGKITNKLEELSTAYIFGQEDTHQLLEEIKAYHFNILNSSKTNININLGTINNH